MVIIETIHLNCHHPKIATLSLRTLNDDPWTIQSMTMACSLILNMTNLIIPV